MGLHLRLVTGADWPRGDDETRFLARVLCSRGWSVDVAIWSDPTVEWGDTPLTLIRSTWDYPRHLEAFLAWAETTERHTALHNPATLVRHNVDKRYLLDLGRAGIPTIPSRWLATLDREAVSGVLAEEGWSEPVVKPAVGVDGVGVARLGDPAEPGGEEAPGAGGPPSEVTRGGWLVQPFVPSVASVGERSVVLFDGRPAHAVTKWPPDGGGEFRVQERWGGRTRTALPDPVADALAGRALATFVGPTAPTPLYARIDLLEWEGAWHVAEVEAIEPSFYLADRTERVLPLDAALRRRLP